MDHETDKQDSRSTEGGEMKAGDKVWVLCEVKDKVDGTVRVEGAKGATWWMYADHCRPEAKMLDSTELASKYSKGIEVQGE